MFLSLTPVSQPVTMNNAVSLSHLVLGLRPDKDGGKFSVTETCTCVERVAGTEPVSLAGVCTVVWKGWLVQSLYLLQECAQRLKSYKFLPLMHQLAARMSTKVKDNQLFLPTLNTVS